MEVEVTGVNRFCREGAPFIRDVRGVPRLLRGAAAPIGGAGAGPKSSQDIVSSVGTLPQLFNVDGEETFDPRLLLLSPRPPSSSSSCWRSAAGIIERTSLIRWARSIPQVPWVADLQSAGGNCRSSLTASMNLQLWMSRTQTISLRTEMDASGISEGGCLA